MNLGDILLDVIGSVGPWVENLTKKTKIILAILLIFAFILSLWYTFKIL